MKKLLTFLLVIAITMTMAFSGSVVDTQAKSGKVKGITVSGVKKNKITLTEGTSKKLKVSVKTKGEKVSKAFTVKSGNSKVVKVSKKGSEITLKAVKKGTAKVIVKSKANKKKKKTIRVTVVAKESKNTVMTVTQLDGYTYRLDFSKDVTLKSDNIKVEAKSYQTGSYNKTVKISDITTESKKSYVVTLDEYFGPGMYLRFTVSDINKTAIVSEIVVKNRNYSRTYSYVYTCMTGKYMTRYFGLGAGYGYGKIVSVSEFPAGLEGEYDAEHNEYVITGIPTKQGVDTTTIITQDEFGVQYVYKLTFVIGSASQLVSYAPDKTVYVYNDTEDIIKANSTQVIYVAGGSGRYKITGLTGDTTVYSHDAMYYFGEVSVYYNTSKAGIYNATVTVQDAETSLSGTVNAKLIAKSYRKITGKVTTGSGKAIENAYVSFESRSEAGEYYISAYTQSDGTYTAFAADATYDMYAYFNDAEKKIHNKKISADGTQNFNLPIFEVMFASDNTNVSANAFTSWLDKTEKQYYGYGSKVYFKAGTYDVFCTNDGTVSALRSGTVYTASAQFTVSKDMTVTAHVISNNITEIIKTLNVGTNDITGLAKTYQYFKFVAPSTGYYEFRSLSNDEYWGIFYDEKNDDYNDVFFDFYNDCNYQNCEMGKTYYIALRNHSFSGIPTQLKISKSL